MDQIESLALFPLSDVVLLPEVSVPLFIFEPRYRQMTRDVLEGSHRIGMVTVRPDGLEQMAGDPPIFEIGCIGRIAHAQQRPDGTFQIMLVGESRFRVLAEHARSGDRLYRSARAELLPERSPVTPAEHDALRAQREQVLSLLEEIVRHISGDQDPDEVVANFARLEPPRLVNALTRSISFSAIERQQLLQADSITGRFEIMADLLRFRLAERSAGESRSRPLPN